MAKYEKKMMQFEAFRYNGSLSRPAVDKDFDESKHAPEWAALAVIKGVLFFEGEGEKKRRNERGRVRGRKGGREERLKM